MKYTTAALALVLSAGLAWAAPQGNATGHTTESGQGNLANDNVQDNPGTTSVSGPPGQISKDNVDCNNCSSDPPGNGR